MRRLMKMTVIAAALASGGLPMSLARAEDPPADATLAQLAAGKLKIVDLAWPLNSTSPYWPGDRYEPFTLKTIATIERDGVLSKSFCSPEHLGTHLDAPNHFAPGQKSVDQLDPHDLFAPGVVLDIVAAAAADADYRLTAADVAAWEQRHGRIPSGAIVLLRTGWGRFWSQPVRYAGKDVQGVLHFPGYSVAAAEMLVKDRNVRGIGIDTLSIDYGPARDFAVHRVVNGRGRFGLENLAHLEQLPETGFYLFAAPIKIETGSGGPCRVFAIVP